MTAPAPAKGASSNSRYAHDRSSSERKTLWKAATTIKHSQSPPHSQERPGATSPTGWLKGLYLLVTGTGLTAGTVTADGPFNIFFQH